MAQVLLSAREEEEEARLGVFKGTDLQDVGCGREQQFNLLMPALNWKVSLEDSNQPIEHAFPARRESSGSRISVWSMPRGVSSIDFLEGPRLKKRTKTRSCLVKPRLIETDLIWSTSPSPLTYGSYQSNKYVSFNLGNYSVMHEISDVVLPRHEEQVEAFWYEIEFNNQ